MAETIAVALIQPDEATQRWLREALPPDEFTVTVHRAEDAYRQLPALPPRATLVDAASLERDAALREAVIRLRPPSLLLALASEGVDTARLLEQGADDVIVLPTAPELLRARLRSGLRLLRRALASHEVRGEIGPEGVLGILKHCEDHRLSGRLTVEGGGRRHTAEFLGGELERTASEPQLEDGDDLAALMSLRDGCYVFVQATVDPLDRAPQAEEAERVAPAAAPSTVLEPPAPIVTRVAGSPRGEAFEVRTRGENRPDFTIGTTILRGGLELRETVTSWPHPITNDADLAQAWLQMVQQHERVTAKLREMVEPRHPTPAPGTGVDGTLLSWALHFVVELAWAELGSTVTSNLLARTQTALAGRWPQLLQFHIGERAQVAFDPSRGPTLTTDAVEAVAAWLAAFVYLARRAAPSLAQLDLRQATVLMAPALEKIGFYAALATATASCERNGVRLEAPSPDGRPDAAG